MNQNIYESRTKPILLSVIASAFAMIINYAISFTLTPYIIKTLGTEAHGFVTLAKNIANYMIILTTFFNAYSSRYIVIAFHEGNIETARSYYSTIIIVNYCLLVCIITIFSIIVFHLEKIISIPKALEKDVKLLVLLDVINYMVLTIANVSIVATYIKNKLYITNAIKLFQYICEAVVLIFLYSFFSPKVYYVGIALLFSTIIVWICNSFFKHKYVPELLFDKKSFSFHAVKDLVGRGMWSSFNQLGNVLNSGLDLLVSNLMLSTIAMGELSIVKTLAAIFSTIPGLISQPFQPILLKHYADKDKTQVSFVLKIEIKIMGLIASVIVLGFVVLGKSYYSLWTPDENIIQLYYITQITVIGFLFEAVSHPLYYVYILALKNAIPCVVTILSGLLNVAGMYFLIKCTDLGLYAVVGTTTVLAIVTGVIFTPIYSTKCLKTKWKEFYPTIIRTLFSCGTLFLLGKMIFNEITVTRWTQFILYAILIIICAVPLYCVLVLNREERLFVLKKIEKKYKRILYK